jgi:hypothetical protein
MDKNGFNNISKPNGKWQRTFYFTAAGKIYDANYFYLKICCCLDLYFIKIFATKQKRKENRILKMFLSTSLQTEQIPTTRPTRAKKLP